MNDQITYESAVSIYKELHRELLSMDHNPVPDGLDHLDNFQSNNAERRINAGGSEPRQRARVYASILGVEAEKLGAYVGSLVRKVPQENRWHHQEDLEQSIWAQLHHRQAHVQGSWERVKMVASDAYSDWYTRYANERELSVEAERRAISLERAYARESQDDSAPMGHDIPESRPCGHTPYNGWVGWEKALEANVDATRLFQNLPESIRDLVERKANGEPQNAKERQRLSRWLRGGSSKRNPDAKTNSDTVKAIITGTHIGKVEWHKAIR